MTESNVYRIGMDKRWELEDLYHFPRAYSQNFAFIYCFDTELDPRDAERIDDALQGYPWRGGYSYVNIYTVLKNQVPPKQQPVIASIRYASPGWLDLLLNPDVALQVAKSVSILLSTAVAAAATYKKINGIFISINRRRREARIADIRLSQTEARELAKLTDQLAKHLGFKSLGKLNDRTQNPEISAKLLAAHYRRMKILAEYVKSGKVKLPEQLRDDG